MVIGSSIVVTAALAAGAWAALSTGPTGQKDWYWQNPEPQGNTLMRITSAGDDSMWSVGGPGIVLHSDTGGVLWEAQDPGTLEVLRATDFVSTTTGWVVGDSGTVRKTTDGGATWATQSIEDPQSDLRGVTMVDASTGWLCAADGTLRKTTDGGTSWNTQADLEVRLNDIDSVDSSQSWAVGESGSVRATTDGGSTWTTQTTPASVELRAVDFADGSLGIAVGDEGTVLRTSDGGSTWAQIVSIGTSETITDVHLRSNTTGWIVAQDGAVFYTTTGGTTWTPVTTAGHALRGITAIEGGAAVAVGDDGFMFRSAASGEPWVAESTALADLRDLAFDSPLEGCAVGAAGTVLHTVNGGATWTAIDAGTNASLHGVDCVASGKGWIVGTGGTIRSSVDATSWVGQSAETPISETLYGVDALDDDHAWIVGSGATVLRTTDGGAFSWLTTATVPSEVETLHAVSFVDTQTGYAVGEGGRIIKTVDGGESWDLQTSPTGETLRGVSFLTESLIGYACGDGGVVLKTTDGGTQWIEQDNTGVSANVILTDIQAAGSVVVAVGGEAGSSSIALWSDDAGLSWVEQSTGAYGRPQAARVIDEDNAWIVGEGGMILKATNDLAPVTALEISPPSPDGQDGWYVSPPVVTLTADEPGITFYNWVSTDGPWKTYLSPFTPAEGELTLYYYSVDPAGNAEDTMEKGLKYDGTAPTTPTINAVSAESSSSIRLEFNGSTDDGSGLDYFEIRSGGSVVATTTNGVYTVTDLDPEASYPFTVRAFDLAGNASAESNVVTGTTMAAFARPPTAVYARSMGVTGTAVLWDEPTGTVKPVQYRLWRSYDGAPFSAVATVAVGSYLDADAPRGAELRYAISVVDPRGEGPMSAPTAYSTTANDAPPPAPVEISVANTASVLVTWSPSPVATGYHVYRSMTSTGTATTLTVSPISAASYHDETVAAYTEYWYSVASVDASDVVGAPSPRAYIRTDSGDTSSSVEPPHGAYNTDTDMCALCHATHTATSPLSLLTGTTTNDAPLCLSCHDGTSASDVLTDYLDMTRTSRHAVPFEDISGDLNCSDCHGVHSSEQTATVEGLLLAGESKSGNSYCYECHGEDAAASSGPRGDLEVFEDSAHGAGVLAPPTGTKIVCLSCHISHTSREASLIPYSADDRCLGCHTQGLLTGGATDIAGRLDGAGSDTRHDLRSADSSETGSRLSCGNCHEPHTSTATTPCVDPDSPTTASTIEAGSVTLCLRCHDDNLPTSQDTSGWVEAPLAAGGATVTVNVASSWETTSFHGAADSVAPQLRNDMDYAKGDTLVCADCHDPHGSSNLFALREDIDAKTGTLVADLRLVVPVGASGADLRFFCDSCHEVTVETHTQADLSQWPLDCTKCHQHVGGGL